MVPIGRMAVVALVAAMMQVAAAGRAIALERCLALAQGPGAMPPTRHATIGPAIPGTAFTTRVQLRREEARLTFVGHSTFLIESAEGVTIATDYNDYVKPPVVPDIVTMNKAHDSHYTNFPEPSIRHVLRGWRDDGAPAEHDIKLKDVRVRNIPTHIRGWVDGPGDFGNSIFIFEVGNYCIAHLGHLHHTLKPAQLGMLGQIDVVLVPVDGSYTMDLDGMIAVLKEIRAPLIVPMHYFSRFTLERFVSRVRADFPVRELGEPTLVLNRETMPKQPEVVVLPGR